MWTDLVWVWSRSIRRHCRVWLWWRRKLQWILWLYVLSLQCDFAKFEFKDEDEEDDDEDSEHSDESECFESESEDDEYEDYDGGESKRTLKAENDPYMFDLNSLFENNSD